MMRVIFGYGLAGLAFVLVFTNRLAPLPFLGACVLGIAGVFIAAWGMDIQAERKRRGL
jgi:hypothetical protein